MIKMIGSIFVGALILGACQGPSEVEGDSNIGTARSALTSSVQKESFDTLTLTPDAYTSQSLSSSNVEGSKSVRVTHTTGGTWADLDLTYGSPQDFNGKYLHVDVYAEAATLGYARSPRFKLKSGANVPLSADMAVRVGEWTGLNFDLTGLNQTQLASITSMNINLADSINPGSISFRLDDLFVSAHPLPPHPNTTEFIVFGRYPSEVSNYRGLNGPRTSFAFRTEEFDHNGSSITQWDTDGTPYYFTSASADFPEHPPVDPLYVYSGDVVSVLDRPSCKGLYIHELVTYRAFINNWNWTTAVDTTDWAWLDAVILAAQARGKKVVWSEPTLAWQKLYQNTVLQGYFSNWGTTLVPMYATNFAAPTRNRMAISRDYAASLAGKYGMQLGQSHQTWHFVDQGVPVTRAGSLWLAKHGNDAKASYIQVEGDGTHLLWNSEYMLGVRDYADWLNR